MASRCSRIGDFTYNPEERIGEGRFGYVYKGRSLTDGGYVAIKRVTSELDTQWQAEIEALQKLSSNKASYIVRLIGWRPDLGSSVALIFELADGSVQDLLERPEFVKGFPAALVIQIYSQVSTALNFVIQGDLVHRDLKPGNILFWNQPNNKYLFKVGDFGGARSASFEMRSLVGTVGYACKEVMNNVLERGVYSYSPVECETWALASTLYQLCCGRLPFECQAPKHYHDENRQLHEKAKLLIRLFENRGFRDIRGFINAKGNNVYDERLPLSCGYPNSLRRIMENVIRKLMNSERPTENAVVKAIFEENKDRANELENLRPHRIYHLHESRIVEFYPTSKLKFLEKSVVNAPLSPMEAIGCDCERVKLLFPSGVFHKLEDLNHFEAPSDPNVISCIAFCFDSDSEQPLEWKKTNVVDDPNNSLAEKALSTMKIALMFTDILSVPQEVSNFYGRSLEDFRVRIHAVYGHCSTVSTVFTRFRSHLSPDLINSLTPLIEKIGNLERAQRTQSAAEPFEQILTTVRKMDYGQFDEERICDIYKGRKRQPRDVALDELDKCMMNNVREQLLRKSEKFAKQCYDCLGYALTSDSSPFEAHRKLDEFSEEIRTLSANAFDELSKQMSLLDARSERVGLDGLKVLQTELERIKDLAELNLTTCLRYSA